MPLQRIGTISGSALAFVTTTVADWNPVFASSEAADEVARQLEEAARLFNVAIMGYVIMPTHVHALLGFPDITILSKFMQSFKSLTARRIRQLKEEKSGTLWMRRFDDVIVYSEEQFRTKLEYIHNNPVKTGHAGSPTGWPYSSARDWLLNERGLVKITKSWGWMR